MKHNWELLGEGASLGCSRCGLLSGVETDDASPAITDGQIYAQGTTATRERDNADAALATTILKPSK